MPDRYFPNRRRQPLSEKESDILEQEIGRSLADIEARSGRAVQYAPLSDQDIASGIISREAPRRGAASISEMIESPTALEPRFIPGATVERPDDPRLLEAELLDPVLSAFGMGQTQTQGRPVTPRTFEMGNELVQVDPTTGIAKSIYSRPQQAQEMTPRQKMEYQDLLRQRQTMLGNQMGSLRPEFNQRLAEIDSKIASFFKPPAATNAPAPRIDVPASFAPASTNAPGKRIGRFRVIAQ